MNAFSFRRFGGLLIGAAALACGCDEPRHSQRPARTIEPTPTRQVAAVAQPAAEPAQGEPTKATSVSAAPTWELNPPKSVIAERKPIPHDPGAVFKHYCSVCHGPLGRGDGQYYSDDLPSRPANLTDQELLKTLSDEHLTQVITGGSAVVGKSPLCPPWGRVISKEQVAELVVHIRRLPTLAAQETKESEDTQN